MDFEEELRREQAFNELYMRGLGGENGSITTSDDGWGMHIVRFTPGPIVARLAFDGADITLGKGFYVGPRYALVLGATVVNWESDVGRLLNKRELGGRHGDTPRVIARRVFQHDGPNIVNFFDEPKGTIFFQDWGSNG